MQYGCRFILPEECRVKIICHCEDGFTKVVADEYNKLPLLSSLKEERDQLQKEMKQLSQKDKKRIVSRYNELNQIINDRSTTFLMEGTKSKVRNKYSNFRTVPDKNGIRKVCSGGKVSPK